MKKKWIFIIILLFIFIILSIPKKFYTEDEMLAILQKNYKTSTVTEITNITYLDKRHVIVHYKNDYMVGSSLWNWELFHWNKVSNKTNKLFEIVQLNQNDPSSIYFIWGNLPQENGSVDLYLKRESSAYISQEHSFYYPDLQLKQTVEFNEPHGAVQLNDNLQSLLNKDSHFYQKSTFEPIYNFSFHIDKNNPYIKEHSIEQILWSGSSQHSPFTKVQFFNFQYTDELYKK